MTDNTSTTAPLNNPMHRVFADPGYRPDGKKRYPLDSEGHVRSAWSYINMPKNEKNYTPQQLELIRKRIRDALNRFEVVPKQRPTLAAPTPPPLQLLSTFAKAAGMPMFGLSTEDIKGYCVYILCDDAGHPIYVGQSRDILGRLATHYETSPKVPTHHPFSFSGVNQKNR